MNIESITVWREDWDETFIEDLLVINGIVYSVSEGGYCEHWWEFSRLNKDEEMKILNLPRGKIWNYNSGRMVVSENEEVDEEYKQFILRAVQSFWWRQRENLIRQ